MPLDRPSGILGTSKTGASLRSRDIFCKQNADFTVVYPAMHENLNDFLTKEELKDRLNLPSTRMVDEMMETADDPVSETGTPHDPLQLGKGEGGTRQIRAQGRGTEMIYDAANATTFSPLLCWA